MSRLGANLVVTVDGAAVVAGDIALKIVNSKVAITASSVA